MTHYDLTARLIGCAARSAPAAIADRLHEEWLADLSEQRGPMARLRFGLGCLWAAIMITHDGVADAVPASASPLVVPVAAFSGGHRRPLYSRNELAADAPTLCDINTTPLIDVLLVLLITLILSLPMLNHAVKIDLPQASVSQPIAPPAVINIDIDFDGVVVWNGTPVADSGQLEGYFRTEAQKEPQPEIRVRPNARVKYDIVAKVLASAQRNGMHRMGIVDTGKFAQ